jgi:hypothetical protein
MLSHTSVKYDNNVEQPSISGHQYDKNSEWIISTKIILVILHNTILKQLVE